MEQEIAVAIIGVITALTIVRKGYKILSGKDKGCCCSGCDKNCSLKKQQTHRQQ